MDSRFWGVDGGWYAVKARLSGTHGGFPRSDEVATANAGAGGVSGRLFRRVGSCGKASAYRRIAY